MKRLLLFFFALTACRPKPPAREDAGITPVPSASIAITAVDAGPPKEPEKPLAWGTRAPATGPLFPVVDGMCVHGEIHAPTGKLLYTYGNGLGAFSRGGATTYARIEDDALVHDETLEHAADPKEEGFGMTTPRAITGTWPSLVLFSADNGGGRMRSFESIWVSTEQGWSFRGGSSEKGEPEYRGLAQFKGWLITFRRAPGPNYYPGEGPYEPAVVRSWPMAKDAPPIAGLASLARAKFVGTHLEVAGDSLYAFGYEDTERGRDTHVLRVLKDGKVLEGTSDQYAGTFLTTQGDALVVLGQDEKDRDLPVVRRIEGTTVTKLPFGIPKTKIVAQAVAPGGDIWLLTENHDVLVLRDGKVTVTPLPAPKVKRPKQDVSHWPSKGSFLAGVEHDDPYAIGDSGAVFHFEKGEWREIEMPAPPFATNGQYQAQALVMAEKGDLLVNAGYAEKGLGWKTPERYRALLRTRRPKEVLRCNEPASGDNGDVGYDFWSSPPVADDTCATPFVVVLRLGSKKHPSFLYDKEGRFPTLRAAIKETPGLGATAEMVEIPWGNLQALGVKAPDMATARALAVNAAKRVKSEYLETRPEIVCGVPPKIDRTIVVDVATAKVVTPDAAK